MDSPTKNTTNNNKKYKKHLQNKNVKPFKRTLNLICVRVFFTSYGPMKGDR